MDTTEARLARLERSLSRWRRLAKLGVVGLVCLPFLGQAKPKSTVLVVDHFTVRDREGTPRLVISQQGEISFRSKDGLEVGKLSADGIVFSATDDVSGKLRRVSLAAPTTLVAPGVQVINGDESVVLESGKKGAKLTFYRRLKKQNPRARRAPIQHTDYSVDSVNVYDDFQPLREWDLRSQ